VSKQIEIKAQKIDCYKLHFSNQDHNEIHAKLSQYYKDKTVSINTIRKWTRKFKQLEPKLVENDKQFAWNKCEQHKIPWAQSRRIIDMAYEYALRNEHLLPSWREVNWWSRISQTMPDMNNEEIMQLADAYAKREWAEIIDDVILSFEDLDGYLIYQPYRQQEGTDIRKRHYAEFLKRTISKK
tara:strand:- start:98 stop:646 length:549 start_codon:yes stop_codon:yes gene_type:complete